MAGTLVIDTLSNGSVSTSSTNCIQGSAKAWVQFAGASGTVAASYNVSSVTRTGTGLYTVNFTNAFSDANYAWTGAVQQVAAGPGDGAVVCGQYPTVKTTSALYLATEDSSNNTRIDLPQISISAFR